MGLVQKAALMERTKSGNGVKVWDKDSGKHWVAPLAMVRDFVDGKKASVDLALIVNDPPHDHDD